MSQTVPQRLASAMPRGENIPDAAPASLAAVTEQPLDYAAIRDKGLQLAQEGRANEAAPWLAAAVRLQPDDALAQCRLGVARLALGQAKGALEALDAAAKAQPRWAEAWFFRAQALRAQARNDEALASLEQALALAPDLAEGWLNKGNLLAARGEAGKALDAYDRAARLTPRNATPLFNRGNTLREANRFEEALQSYASALKRDPHFYPAAVNHANLLAFLKRWEEADKAYEDAIAIEPGEADAWMNRGATLKTAGDPERAVAYLRRALELKPEHVEAACNLGFTLRDLGDAEAALTLFARALRLAPRHAKAAHGLALALRDLGRPEDALKAFDGALAADPDLIEAAINRATLLCAHGHARAALASLDRSLSRAPGAAEAWVARGYAQFEMNDTEGAVASHREALRIAPDLPAARFGEAMSHLRILYRDEADIARSRAAYTNALDNLARWSATATPSDEVLRAATQTQPFFLAYQNQNDLDLQRRYGALIRGLVVRRFPDAPPPPLVKGEKLRIGIVSAFFRNHSNWKIPIRGWLEGLDRQQFEIYGYHLGRERDEQTDKAASLCERFVAGKRRTADWRREILSDRPHALIYPGLLMDDMSLLLAAQRLAPVQCNSWGHPETSGLSTMDYFLGSDGMDPPDAERYYSEQLVRLPGLSFVHSPPDAPAAPLSRADLGLRDDAFVYWSGQTLMKYLPQFDDIFAGIAEAAPRSQFVFLAFPRAQEITEILRRRLSRAFQKRNLDFERHCVFVGPFSSAEFQGAVALCDAMLDTMGWSACNSLLECVDAGLPVVTLPGSFLRGRHGLAILQSLGDTDGVAQSQQDYIAKAIRLAEGADHLTKRRREASLGRLRLNSDNSVLPALADFLRVAVERHYGRQEHTSFSR